MRVQGLSKPKSSKPVRCGSPTLGRFDSGAAPLSRADLWPDFEGRTVGSVRGPEVETEERQ